MRQQNKKAQEKNRALLKGKNIAKNGEKKLFPDSYLFFEQSAVKFKKYSMACF